MASLNIKRVTPPKGLISLVPLIDVMLILLVFFMVTSTYLNLDMVPAVKRSDDPVSETSAEPNAQNAAPILIRLGSDGIPAIRGRTLTLRALDDLIAAKIVTSPLTNVIVLPSAAANMQALISVMDHVSRAGATRIRVVRLEPKR